MLDFKRKINFHLSLSDPFSSIDLLACKDQLKIKQQKGATYIFDPIRKKYLILQPEEFVRQLFIIYLIQEIGINKNLIQVEKMITVNSTSKRFDIVIYDKSMKPYVLIECKSPDAPMNQAVFDQMMVYNIVLSAPFIIGTNGKKTMMAKINHEQKKFDFIDVFPLLGG
jgi:hypothetical protein